MRRLSIIPQNKIEEDEEVEKTNPESPLHKEFGEN